MDILIQRTDPRSPVAEPLLKAHLEEMVAITPPGSVYSLDADGLAQPGNVFWMASFAGAPVGSICLAPYGAADGEIKSMHVLAVHRGKGIAQHLLYALEEEASSRGMKTLWLETGDTPGFQAAQQFYLGQGYVPCPRYGQYVNDPNSYCMKKAL
ncbi:MAG: GNAT family N-acetyltransferase [Pseudomonadota bacterium]